MIEFKSLGSFNIEMGKYIVYIVECPYRIEKDDIGKHFKGSKFNIDGNECKIIKVEVNCANRRYVEKGDKIGLAVDNL